MDASNLFHYASLFFVIFAIAAIAGMISERAGVINIATEGYMIIGALFYSLIGREIITYGNSTQLISMLLSMMICGVFSVLQSFISIRLKADQIIAGTAMNILAQGIGLFMVTSGLFGSSIFIASGYLTMKLGGSQKIGRASCRERG